MYGDVPKIRPITGAVGIAIELNLLSLLHLRHLLNKGTAHKQCDKIILMLAAPAMSVEYSSIEARQPMAGLWSTSLRLVNKIFFQRANQREGG